MKAEIKNFEDHCKKSLEHFKQELGRVRTGRAHTSLLDGLMVDYYGSKVPLMQLGMVNAPEPRLLTIQVYDQGAVEGIEKAIQAAELGLNPSRDGNLVRVVIPALTEDRRKEFVKKIHKLSEETKVAIRNSRRDVLDEFKKKSKEVSADELKRSQEEVQKVTDKFIAETDSLAAAREKEVMEV